MNTEERFPTPYGVSPLGRIRRTDAAGAQYWSSCDFAQVLGYSDYRNFEQAVKRAKIACFNSGQRIEDHFGEIAEMTLDHRGAQTSPPTSSKLRRRRRCPDATGSPTKIGTAPGRAQGT